MSCEYHEAHPDFCKNDVHDAFGLTYANYLVLPRVLMQEMPAKWQHDLVKLMDEFSREFPNYHDEYRVNAVDKGRYIKDELRHYRHPNWQVVEAARRKV